MLSLCGIVPFGTHCSLFPTPFLVLGSEVRTLLLEGLQNGRYPRLRLLGSGGMGDVYPMEDTRLNRHVAIKVTRLKPNPYPDITAVQGAPRLFQREARTIAAYPDLPPAILPSTLALPQPVRSAFPEQPRVIATSPPSPSQGFISPPRTCRGTTHLPVRGRAPLQAALALLLVWCVLGVLLVACSNPTSNLTPNATATDVSSQATATVSAVDANPYVPHQGTLALADPLSTNNKGYQWSEDAPKCAFELDGYHASTPNISFSEICLAMSTDYSNLAFEAQVRIIKGDGTGGLVFRAQTTSQIHLYAFYITQNGFYYLNKQNGSSFPTLTSGANPAINQGLDQINLLAVVAQRSMLKLYVNHQLIDQATDSTFLHGQIGFFVGPYKQPTEAVFSNARVWML